MLIEFSCSNHKSIKDKITFSALASKDTSHSDCLLSFEKLNLTEQWQFMEPMVQVKVIF